MKNLQGCRKGIETLRDQTMGNGKTTVMSCKKIKKADETSQQNLTMAAHSYHMLPICPILSASGRKRIQIIQSNCDFPFPRQSVAQVEQTMGVSQTE